MDNKVGSAAQHMWMWISCCALLIVARYSLALWPLMLFILLCILLLCWTSPGGSAWGFYYCYSFSFGRVNTIPGPRGWPVLGSLLDMQTHQPHRRLTSLAQAHHAHSLMAFSLGSTRVVIASTPQAAKDLLFSPSFADRPLIPSVRQLQFGRAMGFAPYGDYWRKLRRIAFTHLFAPPRIGSPQNQMRRQAETTAMLNTIAASTNSPSGVVRVRSFLQEAAVNNITLSIFGRRCEELGDVFGSQQELHEMIREGFELLGAFNISDHLQFLAALRPNRCTILATRVNTMLQKIIDEHRTNTQHISDESDFLHVLLGLQGEEKLEDADMAAILWEMLFRGTDTVAILAEWILAELVLNPGVQLKLLCEIESVCGGMGQQVTEEEASRMQYLQAVVKEALRLHPPGPLLSWARLAAEDAEIAGHHVPKGTTAMVNMWAIARDPETWPCPDLFQPERHLPGGNGGAHIDIRGTDLRLAPFGAGRRVCPGQTLGLSTVTFWVARLVQSFRWAASPSHPIDLKEVLKLSSEMAHPLHVRPIPRFQALAVL